MEDEEEERKEGIPSDLLTVLLHEFFKEKTRMSKGASKAVGKYMDTFVRETVARCSYAGKERGQEGILEVSFGSLGVREEVLLMCGGCRLRTWRKWRRRCCLISRSEG